jgi:hypothetical protein
VKVKHYQFLIIALALGSAGRHVQLDPVVLSRRPMGTARPPCERHRCSRPGNHRQPLAAFVHCDPTTATFDLPATDPRSHPCGFPPCAQSLAANPFVHYSVLCPNPSGTRCRYRMLCSNPFLHTTPRLRRRPQKVATCPRSTAPIPAVSSRVARLGVRPRKPTRNR